MTKQMRISTGIATSVTVLLLLAPSAEAASSGHTKAAAERNIMSAHRTLARWKVGLVHPRTGLLRTNVWVKCAAQGSRTRGGFGRFRCTVGYRTLRVAVTYVAQPANGFELRNRLVYRV